MTVIIDYGMGNLLSVSEAARRLGVLVKVSSSLSDVKKAKKIILPGVGHFGKARAELIKRKIFNLIKEKINEGVPFLGICLGMQLLFEASEEAPGAAGLGVLKGVVKKFSRGVITPHMGWNTADFRRGSRDYMRKYLLKGIKDNSYFYFAHSYYVSPKEEGSILAETCYSKKFCSAVLESNIAGVQFHPEKSHKEGLKFFKNFLYL